MYEPADIPDATKKSRDLVRRWTLTRSRRLLAPWLGRTSGVNEAPEGESIADLIPDPGPFGKKPGGMKRQGGIPPFPLRSVYLGSILSLIMTTAAGAADVFGNGNRATPANTGGNRFDSVNARALPFTTGISSAADRNLLCAWVLVGGFTEIEVTCDVRFYADAGTNQGPTGSALASGSKSLTGAIVWIFVQIAAPVQLDPSANDDVSVEVATTLGGFGWAFPTTPAYSDLGSGSFYAVTTGGSQNVWNRSGTTWSDRPPPSRSHRSAFNSSPYPNRLRSFWAGSRS